MVYTVKTVVLRPVLDLEETEQIVENRKTSRFRSMLQKPKKTDVHVHSLKLSYEAFLILSGKYSANFYRKVIHTINVNPDVKEVIIGGYTFPTKQGKGVIGKLSTKIKSSTRKKSQIDLELEEHVFLEEEKEVAFDHHGKEIKMPYKMSSKLIESYPRLGRRNLEEKTTIDEIIELYVPIYEARLIGPKKNVRIMRIDGIRKKVL